ncbi:MAG TPA: FtsQ-type POTRA domain-containing protein [Sedimenticola sp.]|nr:FtsQ-type POTRA domain-containing protein [Sedimenticola sp.]
MGMAKRQQSVRESRPREAGRPFWPALLRWGLALSLFGAMGAGAVLGGARLLDPQTLPLKVVRIEGEFKYLDRRRLEQVVAAQLRGGFFTVDVEAVRAKVRALPWVDEAGVRRIWPDTLQIRVTEQAPLARWGGRRLLNRRGEVFSPAPAEIPPGLPQLAGPEGTAAGMAARYRAMQARLDAAGLRIVRLQQDERRAWSIEFADGAVIRLGSRDLDRRLARFIRLYPRLRDAGRGRPRQVDLRYTNGFVVHWDEAAADGKRDGKQS